MSKCKIVSVNKSGAVFMIDGEQRDVSFNECAENFKRLRGGRGRCIADRDVTKYQFVFYTEPNTVVVFNGLLKKKQFFSLQKQILKTGFTTYDMS